MNNYETVFILTPVLSDAQMKETVEKFKNILIEQGSEIVNEENWGLRKLAYPIEKRSTGFYTFLEFKADPSVIEMLEVNFRRDERVIRFLTVRQDKFAYEYALKRRKKRGGSEQNPNPNTNPAEPQVRPSEQEVGDEKVGNIEDENLKSEISVKEKEN